MAEEMFAGRLRLRMRFAASPSSLVPVALRLLTVVSKVGDLAQGKGPTCCNSYGSSKS